MRYREFCHESRIAHKGVDFSIIENPSVAQLRSMIGKSRSREGLRGVLDEGNLFVWDGYFMNHDEAADSLGLTGSIDSPQLHLRKAYVELDVASVDFEDWCDGDSDDADPSAYAVRIVTSLAKKIRSNRIISAVYGTASNIMVDDGQDDTWLHDWLAKRQR